MMNQFMSIVTSTLSMSVPLVLAALGAWVTWLMGSKEEA